MHDCHMRLIHAIIIFKIMNVMVVMDKYDAQAELFKVLAHPIRLQILDMLRAGEVCVCHIEAVIGKRQAYISQQLMSLREAGLVETRRDGWRVYYRLSNERVEALLALSLAPVTSAEQVTVEDCPCPACHAMRADESAEALNA